MSLIHSGNPSSGSRAHSVVVTGAAGFIAARIARRLLVDGFPVVAVVRSNAPDRLHRLQSLLSRGPQVPLQIAVCDLHDAHAVNSLIDDLKPATCIHAAWDVQSATYQDDPSNQRWVKSSLHLFQVLREAGCQWLGVTGTCIEPKRQERPSCRYAAAKATLRHRLWEMAGAGSRGQAMQVCWWKIFQPYGPGELTSRLIPSVIDSLLRRRKIEIHHPNDVRDFIHVDDIGSAIAASLAARLSGVFELGTGTGHSIEQAAMFIAERLHAKDLVSIEASARQLPCTELVAHPQPLMSACQWRPEISFEAGLESLIESAKRVHKAIA